MTQKKLRTMYQKFVPNKEISMITLGIELVTLRSKTHKDLRDPSG